MKPTRTSLLAFLAGGVPHAGPNKAGASEADDGTAKVRMSLQKGRKATLLVPLRLRDIGTLHNAQHDSLKTNETISEPKYGLTSVVMPDLKWHQPCETSKSISHM